MEEIESPTSNYSPYTFAIISKKKYMIYHIIDACVYITR